MLVKCKKKYNNHLTFQHSSIDGIMSKLSISKPRTLNSFSAARDKPFLSRLGSGQICNNSQLIQFHNPGMDGMEF